MSESTANLSTETILPAASPEPAPSASPHFAFREMAVFGSIVSMILLTANALVCATLSSFFGLPGWLIWQAGPAALALVFIPATLLRFRFSHPVLKGVYTLSAAWLGILNFAFFASAGCLLVAGTCLLLGWSLPLFPLAATFFGLAGLASIYGLINARWIRVTRVTVRLPQPPENWQGRKVALLTDLHLGPLFGAGFLRRVIARLRSLNPDAVFISGDLFDGSPLDLDQLVAPWSEFSAPWGIYYVAGNHDEFAERNLFFDAARKTGIRVLDNEKIQIDGLQLVGVHDSEAANPRVLRSILRQARINKRQASVLLAHRPINLSVAEEEGISLQLSGHTHGGQIWPWNLLVSRMYGRFGSGLSRLSKLQVYTSNGVGTWGPPLRVGTRSEIVLIQFEEEISS